MMALDTPQACSLECRPQPSGPQRLALGKAIFALQPLLLFLAREAPRCPRFRADLPSNLCSGPDPGSTQSGLLQRPVTTPRPSTGRTYGFPGQPSGPDFSIIALWGRKEAGVRDKF